VAKKKIRKKRTSKRKPNLELVKPEIAGLPNFNPQNPMPGAPPIMAVRNAGDIPDVVKIPGIGKSKMPAVIKKVLDPTLRYRQLRYQGRSQFLGSEYDLVECGKIEDTEALARQAFDKKVSLMFKEGWDLVGKNLKTIKYVQARLDQIAKASGVSTRELFRSIGSNLVRKSNAFLVKVRNIKASGGKIQKIRNPLTQELEEIEPIAGLFPIPAETMEAKLEENQIAVWRQRMADGRWYVEWSPLDIVHFYYDRKEGFIFGTPMLVPVADDIRALRKMEENIELLVYQHIFPLFVYQVGTPEAPAGLTETGEKEIDIVRQEIAMMPSEGGIVIPERHKVDILGVEGRALRAEMYLNYFRLRVIAGLGLSEVDFGYGDSSNRSTAETMSRNLVDGVKDLQQVIEFFIDDKILDDLLLESTFGDDVLNEENRVHLKFKEIDVDYQIKIENHETDLFNKNAKTWDEARRAMGLEPIKMPTPEEIEGGEDLSTRYPEWFRTFWKLFDEPKVMIQALKMPFSPLAQTAARSSSTQVNSEDITTAAAAHMEHETAKIKAKPAAPAKKKDSHIQNTYDQLVQDVVTRLTIEPSVSADWLTSLIRAEMQPAIDGLVAEQVLAFRNGYAATALPNETDFSKKISVARRRFTDRANLYVTNLTNHIASAVQRRLRNKLEESDIPNEIRAVLDTFRYRADFITDVELGKAFYLGKAQALYDRGHIELVEESTKSEERCDKCRARHGETINLLYFDLDDIPPHHAGCSCKLKIKEEGTEKVKDEGAPPARPPTSYNKGPIPYDKGPLHNVPSKQAKYTACMLRSKTKIKQQHPNWDDDQVEILAKEACLHYLDQPKDGNPEQKKQQKDAINMESCIEKRKKELRAKHVDWTPYMIAHTAMADCVSQNTESDKGAARD
jgi:hypothetical protein